MKKTYNKALLIPVIGVAIFMILYVVAAALYPGGSQFDSQSVGFSWRDNYWCNLLSAEAMNGMPNPARPIAMAAMLVICVTLALFWIIFPLFVRFSKIGKLTIQISGTLSMLVALMLSTSYHNAVIYAATLFGLIALFGTFSGLLKLKWHLLFFYGMLNLFLTFLDHYIYYTKDFIFYLPVIQKINFALFLTWIACICLRLYMENKKLKGDES